MTAASSVKPKNKFSSRNVNALYKAPALRADFGGVSTGYRTGGVNGLNRMLVLRGPVRGGALGIAEANAVAAPTPINTPSLRKEHMGQDIHVSLVPATKSGGWGSVTSDGSAGTGGSSTEADSRPQYQSAPAAPRADVVHQAAMRARERENSWIGGAPAVAKPPTNIIRSMLSSGSGRWGDDAVEEDLVQVEVRRDMEHRREFPDLQKQQGNNNQLDRHQVEDQHSHRNVPMQSQDVRSQMTNAPMNGDRPSSSHAQEVNYRPELRRGYDDHGSNSMHSSPSSMNNRDGLGYHGQHESLQDVRYGSSGSLETYHRNDRTRVGFHQDGDGPRHMTTPQGMHAECASGFNHGQKSLPLDVAHRSDLPRIINNQFEQEEMASHPRLESAWKAAPNTVRGAIGPANVWRMSEAEVSTRSAPEVAPVLSSSCPPVDRSLPADSSRFSTPVSAVRILKREGPRMLFDHKSGTMVQVDESQSSRRSNKLPPVQPRISTESNTKTHQAPQVVEITKAEIKTSASTTAEHSTDGKGSFENKVSKPSSVMNVVVEVVSTSGEGKSTVLSPLATAQIQASNPKSRTKEPKTKRVPMGGKMKRVVVAYRPVMKSLAAVTPDEKPASDVKTEESVSLYDKEKRQSSLESLQEVASVFKERKSRQSLKTEREKKPSVVSGKTPTTSKTGRTDSARPKIRVSNEAELRAARSETKQKSRKIVPASKTNDSSYRTKHSTADRKFDASFSSKDDARSEEMLDDGGGAFTTVKSRRAVLQERKKQREQLAAALTGFHERCDVKRPNNRVAIPASIARFGRKGLLVGFKQKSESSSSARPPPLPVLEKSFIDIIRPPVSVHVAEPFVDASVNKVVEDSVPQKAVQEGAKRPRPHQKRRADIPKEHIERQLQGDLTPGPAVERAEQKMPSTRHEARVEQVGNDEKSAVCESKFKGKGIVEAKYPTTATQLVPPEKRVRIANALKKEVKRIYVPKVAPVQVTSEVPEASTPMHVAPCVKSDSSAVADQTKVTLNRSASQEEVIAKTIVRVTKVEEVYSLSKKKAISSTLSEAPTGQSSSDIAKKDMSSEPTPTKRTTVKKVKSVKSTGSTSSEPAQTEPASVKKMKPVKSTKDASSEPTATEVTSVKNVKSSKSTKRVEQQKSTTTSAGNSNNHLSTKQSTKKKPAEPTSTPPADSTPPSLKVSRRTSSFKETNAKSITSSASSQKIYRQVYVVKTTSTAAASSPSAA